MLQNHQSIITSMFHIHLLQLAFCCNSPSVVTHPLFQLTFCCNFPSIATHLMLQLALCCNSPSAMTYILLQFNHPNVENPIMLQPPVAIPLLLQSPTATHIQLHVLGCNAPMLQLTLCCNTYTVETCKCFNSTICMLQLTS
jgi:hypothetical protein